MPPSHPPDKLSPAARLLGRSVTKSSPESHTVELEYEARPEFANRHGTISGGFLAAMLDSATAAPALLLMDATRTVVTTDLHVTFERPARVGRLTAVSQLVSHDDLEIHSKSELRDSEGKLVARAIATFRIVRVRVANPEKSS